MNLYGKIVHLIASHCLVLFLSIGLPYDEKKLLSETGVYGFAVDHPIRLPEIHQQGKEIFSRSEIYDGVFCSRQFI